MTITVTQYAPKLSDKISKHRKEKHFYRSLTLCGIENNAISNFMDVRFYATDARHYCCVWVNHDARGSGWAGGYGYHRASAAFQEAFENAGVILSEPVDGRGDRAIDDAIMAFAAHIGVGAPCIIRAHA